MIIALTPKNFDSKDIPTESIPADREREVPVTRC
jgi:hypothetical protein